MKISSPKNQLVLKALFFIYYAGIGQFFTFLNIYYRDIGLSGIQIGWLGTLVALIGIFSTTFWGMLSDKFGRPRWLFMVAFLGTVLGMLALSTVQTFPLILLITCLVSPFSMTLMPLLDSTALGVLGSDSDRYGTIRVWGSIGYIVTSSMAGFFYEWAGLRSMFFVFTALMTLAMVVSFGLPDLPVRLSGSPWGGLRQMVRQPRWVVLAGCAFFIWLAVTGMLNFLGVMLKGMGGTDGIIGITWTISALVELPGMALGALLLRRFGPRRLILAACGFYAARMFLYAFMPSPSWALWIGILNGISYVPFWVGAVAYATELAPVNLKATSQGLLFSVMNLASVVGGLASGWLFDKSGPAGLFGVMGSCCVAALILFAVGQVMFTQRTAPPVQP
jgi:MFS family permease